MRCVHLTMSRILTRRKVTPTGGWLGAMLVAVYSMASLTSAWNIHSSLSNATAAFFVEGLSFRVYLLPDEILDYILLPGYNCSIIEDQAYVRTISDSGEVQGTLLQWNNKAPPEKNEFILKMYCAKICLPEYADSLIKNTAALIEATTITPTITTTATPPSITTTMKSISKTRNHRVARDANISTPQAPLNDRDSIVKDEAIEGSTEEQLVATASSEHPAVTMLTSTPSPMTASTAGSAASSDLAADAPSTPAAPKAEFANPKYPTPTTLTTDSQISTTSQPVSELSVLEEESILDPKANDSKFEFSLVITRLSMDFVHGQKLFSLEEVFNITGELELATLDGRASNSSTAKQLQCFLIPKGVRLDGAQYVLLAIGLNSTSGKLIRAGNMLRSCGYENWFPAKNFFAEAAHVRSLDAKLFHLQLLSICLAAAVIVFVSLAVFLCTKWRLVVRGSRREASDEFYIKTFYTKEHQYAVNCDDFYGFPTIRRDRSPNSPTTTPNSIGGTSFINGGFQDGEDHQSLPAPPPELQTCIISDANFTDVPLQNLGSDSLRPHRGAHRHRSPPPPPLRTVSSGYMSGHSTPADEYQDPHEVMMLPPIPKEDYSDSDSDSSPVSLETGDGTGRAVERKGRFTVRTAL